MEGPPLGALFALGSIGSTSRHVLREPGGRKLRVNWDATSPPIPKPNRHPTRPSAASRITLSPTRPRLRVQYAPGLRRAHGGNPAK